MYAPPVAGTCKCQLGSRQQWQARCDQLRGHRLPADRLRGASRFTLAAGPANLLPANCALLGQVTS